MINFNKLKNMRAGLMAAIESNDFNYLNNLLANKCDSNGAPIKSKQSNEEFINLNFLSEEGSTPLHQVCMTGNLPIMKLLVLNGASQHIKNKDGWFPIHLATYTGNMEIIMFLLNADNFKSESCLLVVDKTEPKRQSISKKAGALAARLFPSNGNDNEDRTKLISDDESDSEIFDMSIEN